MLWKKGNITSQRKINIIENLEFIPQDIDTRNLIPAQPVERYTNRFLWRTKIQPVIEIIDDDNTDKWETYRATLQPWEQNLMKHITILCGEDELKHMLSSTDTILNCVSDGSVANSIGTYGWVLAIKGNHLVSGYGGVPGFPLSSLRSEACGKLAWLTWLVHYSTFHNVTIHCKIMSYCDNKAVVSKSVRHNDYQNPSHTTTPNFDIFKTIYLQQQKFHSSTLPNTIWVKGHQDSSKPIQELPIPAQLNIHADSLATLSTKLIKDGKMEVPYYLFPEGLVWITSNKTMYSSQELFLLRWKYPELQLQKYYEKHIFNISRTKLHEINWAGLRLARTRLSFSEQSFSIKQMIGWLPTGHKTQQYGQLVNHCPMCKHADETIDHVWLCPTRIEHNKATVLEFQNFLMSENTNNEIASAFVIALNRWFRITPSYTINDRKHVLWHTMEKQNKFGWNFFVRGLVINDWAYWQEQHAQKSNTIQLGDSWSSKISEWWIQKSRAIWLQRNEKSHNCTKENESRLEQETFAQIRKLYDTSHLLSANDREIFSTPMEDLIQQPIHSLQLWVRTAWPTVRTCLKNYSDRIVLQNQRLSQFLQQRNINPTSPTSMNPPQENQNYSIYETSSLEENDKQNGNEPAYDILQQNLPINISNTSNTISPVKNPSP